jgi:hypothetical protein
LLDPGEIRVFSCEEFDNLNTRKEFLEQFGTLIGEKHRPLTEKKQETYEPGLYRYHKDEDSETSQSARAQVDQEDGQTDYQLDRSGPVHVEELPSEVDARNVSGDVVDQFSIGMDVAARVESAGALL